MSWKYSRWPLPALCPPCSAGGELGWVMLRGGIDGVVWQILSAAGFTCKVVGRCCRGCRGVVGH